MYYLRMVTLYTRPRDEELWDWARVHADETHRSLSSLITELLRIHRRQVEAARDREAAR